MLTLSLVLLMALLAAMYGALYFSERLVRPVQDLIAGTRAVAKGDFDTRIERPSHDEIGFLVTSFNDMTKKLARAREETERSRAAVEAERAALAVILARLTSGVISLEPDLRVRVANQAAGTILGVDFSGRGRPAARGARGRAAAARRAPRACCSSTSRRRRDRVARAGDAPDRRGPARARLRLARRCRATPAPRASCWCSTK